MKRGNKIILGIFISIIIAFGFVIGGVKLWDIYLQRKPPIAPPPLDFLFDNTSGIIRISGYGYVPWGGWHNGFDFIINTSSIIIAPCDMEVTEVTLEYLEGGGHWAVKTTYELNKDYFLLIGFESWALNETYGNYQLDEITVDVGQLINKGEVIGTLLYHRIDAHIHYALYEKGDTVCPYPFFSEEAKIIFDMLWSLYGVSILPCNETLI